MKRILLVSVLALTACATYSTQDEIEKSCKPLAGRENQLICDAPVKIKNAQTIVVEQSGSNRQYYIVQQH